MSTQRKTIEEKVKKEKETLQDARPLKELTLAEVGMEIPPELAGPSRWCKTDGINTIKSIRKKGKDYSQTLLCEALLLGYYDYALALINTYNRKDKMGLDPNVPGFDHLHGDYTTTPLPILIENTVSDSIGSSSLILADALIKAGVNFSFVKYTEYFNMNMPKWNFDADSKISDDWFPPLNYLMTYHDLSTYWFRNWTGSMEIPSHVPSQTFLAKKIYTHLQFLTENLVENHPNIKTKNEFIKLVEETIPSGQKMPSDIYNLIFDYLPFNQIPLQEVYNPFEIKKVRPDHVKYFWISLQKFLREQHETYANEQRRLQKIEVARLEKEEAEISKRENDLTIQKLKTKVAELSNQLAQQTDQLAQQNKMLEMQSKQMAQLTSMFHKFMSGSDRTDSTDRTDKFLQVTEGSAVLSQLSQLSQLSKLPANDSVSDQFEIELDTTLPKKRKQKVLILKR